MFSRRHYVLACALLLTLFPAKLKGETPVAFSQNAFVLTAGVTQLFQLDLTTLLSSRGSGQLTWGLSGTVPAWLTLDSPNHRIYGTPATTDFGTSSFNLIVTDLTQPNNQGAIALITLNVSAAPIWSENPLNLGVQIAGNPWSFNLNQVVVDPLGGSITFQATGLPSWMSMTSAGILSGTPQAANIGAYAGINFVASGGHGASQVPAYGMVIPQGAQLALSGSTSFYARTCQKFSVLTKDGAGNTFNVFSNSIVSLTATGTASSVLYSNSSCSGTGISNVVIQQGTSASDFYVLASQAGTLSLSATFAPFIPATLSATVLDAGVPSILLSAPQTQPVVGSCAAVALGLFDVGGQPYYSSNAVSVSLSASRSDLVFYSDGGCSSKVTSVTVPADNYAVGFFVSATVAESVTLTASSQGFNSGSVTLSFQAGAAKKIQLSTASLSHNINTCWMVTISMIDSFNNPATMASALVSPLEFLGTAASGAQAFSDAQCMDSETSVTIAAGQSSSVFYMNAQTDGNLTIEATPASLPVAALQVTIIRPANISFAGLSNLNFGNVIVGTTKDLSLTLVNLGGNGSITSLSIVGGEFMILPSSTCKVNLVLGLNQSCVFNVRFSPAVLGAATGAISIVTSSGALTSQLSGNGISAPTPPTVAIYANNTPNYLVLSVADNAVITWTSVNAATCTVTENDLAARYQSHPGSGTVAGTWAGPNWSGLSGAQSVVGYSDPAERDVTYTLTCSSSGGTSNASVRVRRYGFAAGGPEQVAYILGSLAEAQSCEQYIHAGIAQDYNCRVATWGTFWADGTRNPWWVKPGTAPGQKWCSCFNPKTSPAGKPWAVKFGAP